VIHPLLKHLQADLRFSFLDDLTLAAKLITVARDVGMIGTEAATLGLTLKTNKCELICNPGHLTGKQISPVV